jgi:hypothetical protein
MEPDIVDAPPDQVEGALQSGLAYCYSAHGFERTEIIARATLIPVPYSTLLMLMIAISAKLLFSTMPEDVILDRIHISMLFVPFPEVLETLDTSERTACACIHRWAAYKTTTQS